MPIQVLMPALSPTMEKGNLAKWLKKEGDAIKSGDVIAEIETDKATMEVEAIDDGTLGKILVPEGTNDVAVNTPIAMILAEGEDRSALARTAPAPAGDGNGAAAPAQAKAEATQPARQQHGAESAPPRRSSRPRRRRRRRRRPLSPNRPRAPRSPRPTFPKAPSWSR